MEGTIIDGRNVPCAHRVHGGIDEMDIFINIDLNTFLDVSFFDCPWKCGTSQHKTVEICMFLHEVSVKILGCLFCTCVAFYALHVYNTI